MVAGNDFVNLVQGCGVLIAAHRLQVHHADVIGGLGRLHGEEHAHGAEGHVEAHIVHVVFLPPYVAEYAYHFETDAIHQDEAPNRRPAGKEVSHHLEPKDAYRPALLLIVLIEPATLSQRKIADGGKVGSGAGHRAAGTGKFTYRAY